MIKHGSRGLLAVPMALGLSLLIRTDATISGAPAPFPDAGLCTSVPARCPANGIASGDRNGISATLAPGPLTNITGLIGALGQMIVEAELGRAAVSGRFEPLIRAKVAGSDFALEVCPDTIVGEVSVAERPAVQFEFVIGDFDGDGATDVAARRAGSLIWSVNLSAGRWVAVGLGAPLRVRLIKAAEPGVGGADGTGRCQATWLAEGLHAGALGHSNG